MSSEEIEYIHERIDQVIRQSALEVGLLRLHARVDPTSTQQECDVALALTKKRFVAADAAAAERCGREPRSAI